MTMPCYIRNAGGAPLPDSSRCSTRPDAAYRMLDGSHNQSQGPAGLKVSPGHRSVVGDVQLEAHIHHMNLPSLHVGAAPLASGHSHPYAILRKLVELLARQAAREWSACTDPSTTITASLTSKEEELLPDVPFIQ